MAAADEYPNPDDDEFDDYNPHPYSGGYDISATYGAPLPSSPSTCYPISSHLHSRRSPHPRTHRSAAALACACCVTSAVFACATAVDFARAQEAATAAGGGALLLPEPYDYGDAPRDQPMYATPEVFRGWPYFAGAQSRCGRDYWRQCMRGLDYLFGHSDGYGERRIGVDYHGVPVYANREEWRTPWSSRWCRRPLEMWSGTTPARNRTKAMSSCLVTMQRVRFQLNLSIVTISTLVSNRYMLRLSLWKQFILTTWSTMRTSQHTTTKMISIIWRCQDIHTRYSPMHTYQMIHLNLISLLGL